MATTDPETGPEETPGTPEFDAARPRAGVGNKTWMVVLLVLVLVFVGFWVFGAIAGLP